MNGTTVEPSQCVLLDGCQVCVDRTILIPFVFPVCRFDVFPLPMFCVPENSPPSKSRRSAQRFLIRRSSICRMNSSIRTLNSLFSSDLDVTWRTPSPISARQLDLIQTLYQKCRRVEKFLSSTSASIFEGLSGSEFETALREAGLHSDGFNDPATLHQACLAVDIDKLSLPGVAEGAVVRLLDVLPRDIQSLYRDGSQVLLSAPPDAAVLQNIRVVHRVKGGRYPDLIDRLVECGLVQLFEHEPTCVNGLFAVKKDESSQRLIFDARRANKFFKVPPALVLTTLSMVAELFVEPGNQLFIGKSDVRNMYHRFRVPDWMVEYFGLPMIERTMADGTRRKFWPCVVSLPMGFSHAVFLAHTAHLSVIKESLQWPIQLLLGPGPFSIGSVFLTYIDDHVVFSSDVDAARDHLQTTTAALDNEGLFRHDKKYLDPADSLEADVLGATVSRTGILSPSRKRLAMVEAATRLMLERRHTSPVSLAKLIGVWVWLLLLNRCLLSILSSHVYRFISLHTHTVMPIPLHVIRDLELLLGVAPFLFVDLHARPSRTVMATDASGVGGAVVSTTVELDQWEQLYRFRESSGWFEIPTSGVHRSSPEPVCNLIQNLDWTLVRQWKWKHAGDLIFRLEAHALLVALRNMVFERADMMEKRVVFMLDSSSVVGAAAKGRSSSDPMNHLCRRIASLVCASGIRPIWLWISTLDNPADEPSRVF